MKGYLTAACLFLLAPTSLGSQNLSENFLGSWYTYGSTHRLSERFSLSPYGEFRFYEPSSNYNLAFISLRGNYHLNTNSTVGFGYAFLDIDTVFEFDQTPHVLEHRLFQQFTYSHRFKAFHITHRPRLEQRLLDLSNKSELQHRFRYRLGLRYDINKTFYLHISEEPFINFQDQAFHENRFYSGIGINLLKNSQIQIGYLKQHIRRNNLNRIQIGISFQTDSRKLNTTLSQK